MRKLKHIVEYIFVYLLVKFVSILSWESLSSVSKIIARGLMRVLAKRDEVARDNISSALGCDARTSKKLAFESFHNLVLTILEVVKLKDSGVKAKDNVYFTDLKPFKEVYEKGRGCLLISAHLGNWEIMAKRIVEMGYPVNVLVKAQTNSYVEDLFRRIREDYGVRVLYTGESAREIVRLLKNNEFVAILVDQDAGIDGVFYPFFGRTASWEGGPAKIARKFNTPIIMGFDHRFDRGAKHIAIISGVDYLKDRYRSPEDEFFGIYIKRLEEQIELSPGQYHWLHRRWRTRLPEEVGE